VGRRLAVRKRVKLTENVLTANNNKIDAILASTKHGAGRDPALKEQNLAGKNSHHRAGLRPRDVPGDRGAGWQTMSVYKPLPKLASAAVQTRIRRREMQEERDERDLPNGQKDVPRSTRFIAVDKTNILQTVIAGWFSSTMMCTRTFRKRMRPPRPGK